MAHDKQELRRRVRLGRLLAWCAALVFGACGGEHVEEKPLRPRGVLLVAVDGLRPDAIDVLAGHPALATFLEESVSFEEAFTPAPLALPATASLLTGRDPREHGARDDGATTISDEVLNLAEILSADGYRARAAVSSSELAPGSGLERGFESFDAPPPPSSLLVPHERRRAGATVDQAMTDLIELERERELRPFLYLLQVAEPLPPFTPPDVARDATPAERYTGEVRTVERELGRLFAMLASKQLDRELVIVLVGTRGATVTGADAEILPGEALSEDALRVPLLVHAPGLEARAVGGPVSLVDVLPTVLGLLGVPPPAEIGGRSLLPAIQTGATPPGYSVAVETWHPWLAHDATPLAGVIRDDLMLVRGASATLIDRAAGTAQTDPVDARATALLAEIERRFGRPEPAWLEANDGAQMPRVREALGLLAAGSPGKARQILTEVIETAPGDPTAIRFLAAVPLSDAQPALADVVRAEPLLQRALERRPDDPALLFLQARCAATRERHARREALVIERNESAEAAMVSHALADDHRDRRIELLRKALKRAPTSVELARQLENALPRED